MSLAAAALTLGLLLQPQTSDSRDPLGLDAAQLDDIEVVANSPRELIQTFVDKVAAPPPRRGLALWRERICVGVFGVKAEQAQFIADRVSWIATEIGLQTAEPGCTPNVFVIGSRDANDTLRSLVDELPKGFRFGGADMDRGGPGLRGLLASERPVLAWHTSIPVNSDTGTRAVRMPGETDSMGFPSAPVVEVRNVSRLSKQIQDDMQRSVIVFDAERMHGVNALQLADYIALSSLAQINTESGADGYASILNVFERPEETPQIMSWDLLYLKALYGGNAGRTDPRDQTLGIVREAQRLLRLQQDDQSDLADGS